MRAADQSYVLSFGRLLQQYVVDMYVKIETMRLLYIRSNQEKFRVDFYQGIIDSIAIGVSQGRKIGKRILLPASFIGGPRDMRRRYVDAMALVRRFGKPDIFLTMTCNPMWPEIRRFVEPYEERQSRPDLAARVFRAKVEIMKKRITVDRVFGEVASLVYVIEYQKRGLPHAHFLIILAPGSKLLTPDAFDNVVCAELPNQRTDPELHKIVASHMFHGPCGDLNKGNSCMRNGQCKNKFPRRFCDYTTHGKQAYPEYRIRVNDAKDSVRVGRHLLDNRWISAYNPRLLREFDCHMNVEVCCDIRAIKYLYKYVYKGIDKVSMKITDRSDELVHDENYNFKAARWISPPEAVWRIYKFKLFGMYPAVKMLQVHLENFQSVRFSDDDELADVATSVGSGSTMLTEFFRMNSTNEKAIAMQLYYVDFPEHFVWYSTKKRWTERKRGQVIGRLISVNPTEGDRYYLRLLLMNVKGPKSYADLLTVNGSTCDTFREAANLRGLLLSDTTFEHSMQGAVEFQVPCSIRLLFAIILAYCEVSNPAALYQKFFDDMSEDYRRYTDSVDDDDLEEQLLGDLDKLLEGMGKSINNFGLAGKKIRRDRAARMTRELHANNFGMLILW